MRAFALTAGLTVATAAALSAYAAFGTGLSTGSLLGFLTANGEVAYATWLVWLLVAPFVLAGAALAARRAPAPWVVACTLHLTGVVALAARTRQLVDERVWIAVAAVVAVGLASVVTLLDRPPAVVS